MADSLPYLSSPGTIDSALRKIQEAATPPRFTNDFVKTVLQIKGGAGTAIPPFLKKLGLLNADGTPAALYDRLRNESSSRAAVAEAIRNGYKPLYRANEYAHRLNDADLRGLILQVTGLQKDNRVSQLIAGTFKKLNSHASFDELPESDQPSRNGQTPNGEPTTVVRQPGTAAGVNLTYTINLNLPTTTNIEVFNAIFKSLKEHLVNG